MTNTKIILKIADKEFVLDSGSVVDIYSNEKGNFVRYNGSNIQIGDDYYIPELDSNEVPISIKTRMWKANIILHKNCTDTVILVNNARLDPGDFRQLCVMEDKKEMLTIKNVKDSVKYSNLNMEFKKLDESEVVEKEDSLQNNVLNKEMYSNNKNIETYMESDTNIEESEEKYYTSLDVIPDDVNNDYIKHIGSGSFRKVYKIKDKSIIRDNISEDIVVKVARNENGVQANKREFQTWQTVKGTELEKYFCPILDRSSDLKYIFMKEADEILVRSQDKYECSEILEDIKSGIKRKIKQHSINTPANHGLDISFSNIGKISNSNNFVLIDYPFGANFQYMTSKNE